MKENIIKDKSYQFSIEIIKLVRKFPKNTDAYIISTIIKKRNIYRSKY